VTQTYCQLVAAPRDENGWRSLTLAKFGNYEVRLLEESWADAPGMPQLWVDLYARHTQSVIDSCRCHDLEAAVAAAENIMSQATKLDHASRQTGSDQSRNA
jgi:hypothetical protein